MATTNLSYASIGSVEFSSGNGSPDHISDIGSLYINVDTGTWFYSHDNGIWTPLKISLYGEIFISEQITTIGVNAQNTWFSTANRYEWVNGVLKGVYINNNKLQVRVPGLYRIVFNATIRSTTTLNALIEGMLIKNESTTSNLANSSVRLNATSIKPKASMTGQNYVQLEKDDRIEFVIRNTSNSTDFILDTCLYMLQKISD